MFGSKPISTEQFDQRAYLDRQLTSLERNLKMNLKDEEVLKLSDSETSKEERTKLLAKKFRMEKR